MAELDDLVSIDDVIVLVHQPCLLVEALNLPVVAAITLSIVPKS